MPANTDGKSIEPTVPGCGAEVAGQIQTGLGDQGVDAQFCRLWPCLHGHLSLWVSTSSSGG